MRYQWLFLLFRRYGSSLRPSPNRWSHRPLLYHQSESQIIFKSNSTLHERRFRVRAFALGSPFSSEPEIGEVKQAAVVINVFSRLDCKNEIKKELESNDIWISHELVSKVLEALESSPDVAERFFQWILELYPSELSSISYNTMLLILGVNGRIDQFWSLVDDMRKQGYCVSGYVRDKVSEKFQNSGLVRDVERLKGLFATEDSLSRMVCKIVKNNSSDIHKSLEDLQLDFKSSMVKLTLERLSDVPAKAFFFFRWLVEFGRFTHDEKTYNAMAKILGRETSLGSFQEIFREMKTAGYEIETGTYERVFNVYCLVNRIDEAVDLFEFAMAGSSKPASDFPELVRKIVSSKELDMSLFSRALKAYSSNGYTLSVTTQRFLLGCLKPIGQRRELLRSMNANRRYEASELGELKLLLGQRKKPNEKGFHGQIVEDIMIAVDDIFLDELGGVIKPSASAMYVKDIIDAKSVGIKGSMIPTSSWIVLRALKLQGFESYLVGGCVRDLLLNRVPRDFDVVTTASLLQVQRLFIKASIVGKTYPICHVYISNSLVEVAATENMFPDQAFSEIPSTWEKMDFILYKNSQKRDFTINSMFLDPTCFKLYDYNSGMADIRTRKLRTVITADQSFTQDCVRILRGVRIAARLDLSFSEEIEAAIPTYVDSVARLNSSRLMREMHFLLSYGAAVSSIKILKKSKLLHILLPFQAFYLEKCEEWETYVEDEKAAPFVYMMLLDLFSSMDKRHSCDNPASENVWITLLAFHASLVLTPQPGVVVCAMAYLLTCEEMESAILYARQHEEHLTYFVPELTASSMSDEAVANVVAALEDLVRRDSLLLVDLGQLCWDLSRLAAYLPSATPSPQVFIKKGQWKRAVEVSGQKKKEVGIILLGVIIGR